ncbi:MAG: hypothetical protein Q7K44_03070 [Candidatus Liptonbacteria bacterium]|nr:hypothetical protein [Candidatus Liptonbacteria bacterium]
MKESFSDALTAALEPAGAVQKLFGRLDLARNTAFFEDDKKFHELNMLAVAQAKRGLEESINALEFLNEQIKAGIRPSGVRCETISEELFHQACSMGDVKLAGHVMVDSVSIPIIENLQEIFGLLLVYMSELEDSARLRARKVNIVVPATEIEARPAAAA